MFATFTHDDDARVIATAVHHGHELRPEMERIMTIDERTRRREEDPYTGDIAERFDVNVVVHHSRFEVDLNRRRDDAVYLTPEDAWGLDLWEYPPEDDMVEQSLQLYDAFYSNLAMTLDEMTKTHGGFVVYDIHSYNHRLRGPDEPAEDELGNPVVNLGTGSMPGKWRLVADAFLEAVSRHQLDTGPIDVRENVRFKGRSLAAFVHDRYGEVGCALAIDVKKVFMDEWSGDLYPEKHRQLGDALLASVDPVMAAWSSCGGK